LACQLLSSLDSIQIVDHQIFFQQHADVSQEKEAQKSAKTIIFLYPYEITTCAFWNLL